MTRISTTGLSSSTGLVSGIDIDATVDALLAVSALPRDLLVDRTNQVSSERAAVDTLNARVLGLQSEVNTLGQESVFNARSIGSSSEAVSVTIQADATPSIGTYSFTPLQTASANQFVSEAFDGAEDISSTGTLTIGFGGHVDAGLDLDEINGGDGFEPGKIKITDSSGNSAVVDLRAATTIDDVVDAINEQTDADVAASVEGDQLRLTDNSGGIGSLTVQEVGGDETAASLGLTSLTTGDDVNYFGADLVTLGENTELASLNDGGGVYVSSLEEVDDLLITLSDGTTAGVDLGSARTLGDVITAIESDEDLAGKIDVSISGDRLVIDDTSGGSATDFTITDGTVGSAATDLGIATTTAGTQISGERLVSALQDTLLSSLNGGQGYGDLGSIDITGSVGTQTVDLSGAETLNEVLDAINAETAATGVTARVNDSRNGILLEDSSGLTVTDSDATNTATLLGIATTGSAASVDSGSLSRQTISETSALSALNGGVDIDLGDFFITDSTGDRDAVSLNDVGSEAETVGDVIDAINATGNGVQARINDTGDGILLYDVTSGDGTLTVAESGDGTTAEDLKILGASTATNGEGQQIIDGSTTYTIDLSDLESDSAAVTLSSLNGDDGIDLGTFSITDSQGNEAAIQLGEAGNEAFTVGDVIDKINEAGIGVEASLNEDGTGIQLTDTAGGTGDLTVIDRGSGNAAQQLGILTEPADEDDVDDSINYADIDEDSQGRQTIDGGFLFNSEDADQSSLDQLVERINDLDAGVTASKLTDLNGSRLVITADAAGADNHLLIDAGVSGVTFEETSAAQDAVADYGGVIVRSQTNDFNGVIDGVDISITEATGEPVTLTVDADDSAIVDAAQDFVDAYNSVRATLDENTFFDAETSTTGLLFGTNVALRVDVDLARVVSGELLAGTDYGSLESVGIELNDDGTLSLDSAKLREAFADDPAAVENLFQDEDNGAVKQLTDVIDTLATDDNSLLTRRSDSLRDTIDSNNARIEELNTLLELERERLTLDFIRMEEALASLDTTSTYLSSIQPLSVNTGNSDS